jgi:hypothetical protein
MRSADQLRFEERGSLSGALSKLGVASDFNDRAMTGSGSHTESAWKVKGPIGRSPLSLLGM